MVSKIGKGSKVASPDINIEVKEEFKKIEDKDLNIPRESLGR